ncbi:MAG: hypothetical protein LAO05_08150 [Acidobacteriia bacterium]|nr:hypothetical protein [Terriglobia bacterium]
MKERTTRRTAAGSALPIVEAAFGGCTTISVSSTRYLDVPQFGPTDANAVEIPWHAPRRPHERLGEVLIEPSGNPSVGEMGQAIRIEAAKMGADAAVLVYDKTRRIVTVVEGRWWTRSAHAVYGRRIIAVAIRYT